MNVVDAALAILTSQELRSRRLRLLDQVVLIEVELLKRRGRAC